VPGLAHPLDLGPGVPAAGLIALATAVGVAAVRRSPRRVLYGLGGGACLLWAIVAWTVMPRWDAHFGQPLRALSTSVHVRDAGREPLLLVGLRRKPSVAFYSGRRTEYARPHAGERLRERLAGPPPRLAIASEADFARLAGRLELEALAREPGYVLFRAALPSGPTP
jgi:hypothetical protein